MWGILQKMSLDLLGRSVQILPLSCSFRQKKFDWRTLPWELVPPVGNPGSATGRCTPEEHQVSLKNPSQSGVESRK